MSYVECLSLRHVYICSITFVPCHFIVLFDVTWCFYDVTWCCGDVTWCCGDVTWYCDEVTLCCDDVTWYCDDVTLCCDVVLLYYPVLHSSTNTEVNMTMSVK